MLPNGAIDDSTRNARLVVLSSIPFYVKIWLIITNMLLIYLLSASGLPAPLRSAP